MKTALLRGGPFDGDEREIWVTKDRIVVCETINTGWKIVPTKVIFHCYKPTGKKVGDKIEYRHCPEESE